MDADAFPERFTMIKRSFQIQLLYSEQLSKDLGLNPDLKLRCAPDKSPLKGPIKFRQIKRNLIQEILKVINFKLCIMTI